MEIIKQTADELIIARKPQRISLVIIGGLSFLGVVLGVIMYMSSVGVMQLTCQRSLNQNITCEKRRSRFLGFTQDEPVTIQQVTRSRLLEATHDTDDGDITTYQVILLHQGENSFPITEPSPQYQQKSIIANQVNTFISSADPSLTLHYERQWSQGALGGYIFFTFVAVLAIASGLHTEAFVFNRSKGRIYLKSAITPLWQRQEEYLLHEIKAIVNNEHTESDGDIDYEAMVVLTSGKCLSLYHSDHRSVIENICQRIQQFLHNRVPYHVNSSSQPKSSSISQLKSSSIFVGKHDTYRTQNLSLEIMPVSHRPYHEGLLGLGFELLGDLQPEKVSIIIWCYAHAESNIYAALYDDADMPAILDFYSVFSNGASLTTTTHKSWIKDMPKCKIYRDSYPSASVQELYNKHLQRMNVLSSQLGRPRSTGDLYSVAVSFDDYRSREPSGLGYKFLLFAHPIFLLLTTGKLF